MAVVQCCVIWDAGYKMQFGDKRQSMEQYCDNFIGGFKECLALQKYRMCVVTVEDTYKEYLQL